LITLVDNPKRASGMCTIYKQMMVLLFNRLNCCDGVLDCLSVFVR